MSGSSTPGKPAKTMSSRLLTMKFMQRAAASAVDEPETPSPKRQRLSTSRPETPNSDLDAVNAAIAAEEQKRAEAVARQAAEAGETNWVLDFSSNPAAYPSQPMIVAADSLDAENQGRKSYGSFQRKTIVPPVHVNEDETPKKSSDSPRDRSSDKKKRKQSRKEEKREKRREKKEELKLHKLTSISGGRGR